MQNQTNQNTQQAAQEARRLYAVATRWYDIGKITEYFVVKETPKTYVVTDEPTSTSKWRHENVVKKSDMEIYDKHFCESYEAALVFKKDILAAKIESNERKIAELVKDNDRYRVAIIATNDGLLTLRGGGNG